MKKAALGKRIAAARAGEPDFVLKNANVVNVFTEEIIPCDVAVLQGVIIGLGEYSCAHSYDCKGAYLCPGFIDSHMHIESSMSIPSEFARIVLPFGTTSVIADPHEIANVCGMEGIRFMKRDAQKIGLNVYYMFPSCVPCIEFEENYAPLSNEDAAALLYEGVVHGLGEVMDWNAVIDCSEDMIKKLELFEGFPIDGHAPGVSGRELAAYIVGGPSTDHEAYEFEEVMEKLRAGMTVMLRVGSAANNMSAVLEKLAENKVPLDRIVLCTDDKHTENILKEGHVNHIARMAVEAGIPAVKAVKMASYHAARTFGLARKGAVAPGYDADLALFSDLVSFRPVDVFVGGVSVREINIHKTPVPFELKNTVNFAPLAKDAFVLRISGEKVPVIEMEEGQLATKLYDEAVPQRDGFFVPDANYAKLACVERHHQTGHIGIGIVKNFGLRCGALASTVAHDSHNIVVIGINDEDMILAVEELKKIGGGYVFARDGAVVSEIPLPVAGLLSEEPYEKLVQSQKEFLQALFAAGVPQRSDPLIRLSFFCLPVIPKARMTPQGLYDVENGKFIRSGFTEYK